MLSIFFLIVNRISLMLAHYAGTVGYLINLGSNPSKDPALQKMGPEFNKAVCVEAERVIEHVEIIFNSTIAEDVTHEFGQIILVIFFQYVSTLLFEYFSDRFTTQTVEVFLETEELLENNPDQTKKTSSQEKNKGILSILLPTLIPLVLFLVVRSTT